MCLKNFLENISKFIHHMKTEMLEQIIYCCHISMFHRNKKHNIFSNRSKDINIISHS